MGRRGPAAAEAVMFDWGGVFQRRPPGAVRRALERRLGVERGELGSFFAADGWLLYSTGQQDRDEFWETACRAFPTPPDAALASAVWDHIFVAPLTRAALFEVLEELRGQVRVGLLSNDGPHLRSKLGDTLGHFDDVVISAEVGCRKPDPEIYQLALTRLGVRPERALFVDDFPHNVAAARELGIRAHRFVNPARLRRWLAGQGLSVGVT